jgi:HEAT repeat protein
MSEPTCQAFINRLMSAADDEARETAAIALGAGGDTCLAVLDDMLASAEADHRFWAIRALWAIASPGATVRLVRTLADDDEMVRSGAVLALGELRAVAAVEALGALIRKDPSAAGRHASDALAKIGQPAAEVLIAALGDEPAWVRVRAAKALVPVESRQAIGPLIHALDDESYIVRHYAEAALARMGVGQMIYFG